jgi:hypothetical protein
MEIIAKVGAALQKLLGECAAEAARSSGVIMRRRKFSGLSLARTFILGFLQNPEASDEELAQVAGSCGVDVTPQAIDQRHTPRLVKFLETLFHGAIRIVVGSDRALAPILERFTRVTILDSSTIQLPGSMQQQFPGCGGRRGGGQAALKLQTELDLRSGAVSHIEVEPGRSSDGATTRQQAEHPAGSLRITDLGYFCVSVFAALARAGVHSLSRLQFGTAVRLEHAKRLDDLPRWLAQQPGPLVDVPIRLGESERWPCRLLAWRMPKELADRRRQKLRQDVRRKRGKEPVAARLALCDWTLLVTSVPVDMLSPQEAVVLYRARWQVELLFKRWKSQGRVAVLAGSTEVRQMVRVWSRLLAVLVQHWLVVASVWGDPRRSLSKACAAVRKFAVQLLAYLDRRPDLERVIAHLCRTVAKTCQRNQRAKPGTFELLNNVSRLEFQLT